MLATLVRDVYGENDKAAVRAAIDDIASPRDYVGFASVGVYVFFDPVSFAVLYVGLARDLAERFAQHNGLVAMGAAGCKRQHVDAWFAANEALGYAMFVQSPMDQVAVHRQAGSPAAEFYDEETDVFWGYGGQGLENVKTTEGILLSSYVAQHGRLPPWNRIRGAVHAPGLATPGGYEVLRLAAGATDSLLLARRSIRALADDPTALAYEEALHVGRYGAIEDTFGEGISTPIVWNALARRANDAMYEGTGLAEMARRILSSGYLLLPPPPPGSANTPGRLLRIPGGDGPAVWPPAD
ncbi:MAG: hypothetical protein QOE05_1255 [Actinomycetota bacterium]|jgi:hypothetical protein|nr:hypothetical protein [Actinomycetota bacterium]